MKMTRFRSVGTFAAKVALATGLLIGGVTAPAQASWSTQNHSLGSNYASIWSLHAMEHRSGDHDLYSQPWWLSHKAIYYTIGLQTYLTPDKRQLKLDVFYSSFENGGDYTSFKSMKTYTLFAAPAGRQIVDYPKVDCYRTIAERDVHSHRLVEMPRLSRFNSLWNGYNNRPDITIYLYGDNPGADIYQGYKMYLGDSWTVQTKQMAAAVPRGNRFRR